MSIAKRSVLQETQGYAEIYSEIEKEKKYWSQIKENLKTVYKYSVGDDGQSCAY